MDGDDGLLRSIFGDDGGAGATANPDEPAVPVGGAPSNSNSTAALVAPGPPPETREVAVAVAAQPSSIASVANVQGVSLAGGSTDAAPAAEAPSVNTSNVARPFYENGAHIHRETLRLFKKGTMFDSDKLADKEGRDFSAANNFGVRKMGRNKIECSRAATSNSRKKDEGKMVLQREETSLVTNCKWGYTYSTRKELNGKVEILTVEPYHNHDCNANFAAVSVRRSGKAVGGALSSITQILAPYIVPGQKIPVNTVRWTIKPYLSQDVVLDSQMIDNIMRSVNSQISQGKYTLPPPIQTDAMRAFTSVDIESTNCKTVLTELIANTDAEQSWIVTRLMSRLAEQDEYFDFRLHYDANDLVDVVTWQTGHSRGCLQKYHSHIFLDARKNETMNNIRMRYVSIVGIDPNHSPFPGSETFAFEENTSLYGISCNFTIEMTPGVTADMIRFGFGDYFLDPEDVQKWFCNIVFSVDPYHFCAAKNPKCILAIDFGPRVWGRIGGLFRSAVYAKTESECLVSRCV